LTVTALDVVWVIEPSVAETESAKDPVAAEFDAVRVRTDDADGVRVDGEN
jgi:hypothetical protein